MNRPLERACEWVYEGTWGVLAEWFKVPRDPPTLPVQAGEHLEMRRPDDGFLRYLKLQFWIVLAIIDIVLTILWLVLLVAVPWIGVLITPLALAVIIVPDIVAYVALHLRYDTTWYVFSDRSIRIRRGIWTIQETTITYENIQNVTVQQGPLQRWFGISNLVIQTAGGGGGGGGESGAAMMGGHMGFLEGVADAAAVRDLMLDRIRASRTTGLGDERHERSVPSLTAWTNSHLKRLSEIRDVVAAWEATRWPSASE